MIAHDCNTSTEESVTGLSPHIRGQPGLPSEVEGHLCYSVRPISRKKLNEDFTFYSLLAPYKHYIYHIVWSSVFKGQNFK